jgi:hypothetical protein
MTAWTFATLGLDWTWMIGVRIVSRERTMPSDPGSSYMVSRSFSHDPLLAKHINLSPPIDRV